MHIVTSKIRKPSKLPFEVLALQFFAQCQLLADISGRALLGRRFADEVVLVVVVHPRLDHTQHILQRDRITANLKGKETTQP